MAGQSIVTEQPYIDIGFEIIMDLHQLSAAHRPRDEHFLPAGDAGRHAQSGRCRLVAVICRHIDNVHLKKLTHHACVLEQGLEAAMVVVRLSRIRGQELAALIHLVANRGDMMLPASGAQETEALPRGPVFGEYAFDVPLESEF